MWAGFSLLSASFSYVDLILSRNDCLGHEMCKETIMGIVALPIQNNEV